MENSTLSYESQASAVSSWQNEVESTPVGFGNGRSLLTEKKNKVRENTELLEKMFGESQDKLGSAMYKLEGYSKQAISKQSWLATKNKKRQVKRVVKSSTKKAGSKHSSPKHQAPLSEKKEWEEFHHHTNTTSFRVVSDKKAKPSPTSRRPKSKSPATTTAAAARAADMTTTTARSETGGSFEVSMSGHFLQKIVLNAWYVETCESIENQLRGLRAHDRMQRRLMVAILLTWRKQTVRNARLRRLANKFNVNNNSRLQQIAFQWWKQSLQTKLSGYYFLQKSRKYDLHRKFRAWKKSSMLSLSKASYLHIMEKHLLGTKRKDVLRSYWKAWRETTAPSSSNKGGKEDTERRLREIVHLWSLRSKLSKVEDKYKYIMSSKAENLGMKENEGAPKSPAFSYALDNLGNVMKVPKSEEEAEQGEEAEVQSGGSPPTPVLGSKIAQIKSEQKELAEQFKQVRASATGSITSMNGFVESLKEFFVEHPPGEPAGGAFDFSALTQKLQSHLEQTKDIAAAPGPSEGEEEEEEEEEDTRLENLREEMQRELTKKQAQIWNMINRNNRKQMVMNVWMGWVTLALNSKQKQAALVQSIRRALSQSKFKWLTQHLLLTCKFTKRVGLHRSFQNVKQRLLFTAWRNNTLARKIEKGKTRLAEQRVRKIQQYSALRHWRLVVSDEMARRQAFHNHINKVCNLDLRNLVRAWQVSAVCAVYDKKVLAKAESSFQKLHLSRCFWFWREEATRKVRNRAVARQVIRKLDRLRLHQFLSAWLHVRRCTSRLEVIGQYVHTQTVKRVLASYFSTWCSSIMEVRHTRNKQELKKLIKQMQKMLTKSKDKLEMVESERDEASKKVGDLVTAVTNLNWKIQYGSDQYQNVPDNSSGGTGRIPQTPLLHITRK
ncbi:hypothetical protein HOP50_12g66190 [Chloropicon primus]|uniref:Sfi1 spindle body domain-containing protein n=1 Tax=Chloropicon primus TaxID=1764295 RepID=A0A5B8MWX4_9CHLO|nr:hypothetical protein A3770_12p66000 [Chloropicon primus]UPR03290.1 hypothetical protein HOP50_12g66190 [Chloropicon primus]|eukprot:QDZ24082.1 hypothetical protein A3770_12p66000 [Chloropicon primus]